MPSAATHPGQLVVEYLEFFNLSQSDIVRRTDLPIDEIANICSARAEIHIVLERNHLRAFCDLKIGHLGVQSVGFSPNVRQSSLSEARQLA